MIQYSKRRWCIINYSISETAQMLSLSKDTLRYYDKLGLVKPGRGENQYRFYTEEDLLLLKYIEVMKFGGLSLAEIGAILRNRRGQTEEERQSTLSILRNKSEDIQRKLQLYQELEVILRRAVETVEGKTSPADMDPVDKMVGRLFHSMGEEKRNNEE